MANSTTQDQARETYWKDSVALGKHLVMSALRLGAPKSSLGDLRIEIDLQVLAVTLSGYTPVASLYSDQIIGSRQGEAV